MQKEEFRCKFSVFGISVSTLNSFEMLYMFMNKLKKASSLYMEDIAIMTSLVKYKELVSGLKQNLKKYRVIKSKRDEREMRKSIKPNTAAIMFEEGGRMLHQGHNRALSNSVSFDGLGLSGKHNKIHQHDIWADYNSLESHL
jgi:hypothetical protein